MAIKLDILPGRQRNRPLKDYTGQRFGRLVGVALVEREAVQNNHLWRFLCDCGNEKDVRIKSARSGHTSSCGCIHREILRGRNETHGLSRAQPSEYRSWKDMRARCSNPNDSDYANYGGRGIKVCERWGDFAAFYADMGNRPAGHTIDRIDNSGNYEPGNCRWAEAKTQANNKRSNKVITIGGVAKTLQAWCDQFGIEHSKVRYRLSRGWPLEAAFSPEDYRR